MPRAWINLEDPEAMRFAEYIAADNFKMGGKEYLSYSASGLVFWLMVEDDVHMSKLVL